MRGLKVFCAFTHQSGMRPDNSLDVYEGKEGEGFVKHYLLDFGEAFGGHGAGKERQWDGYEYFLSLGELSKSFVMPFHTKSWEKIENTPWPAVGPFEGDIFEPSHWKETWRYKPFDMSESSDNYWAAKIIGSLTYNHFKILVDAAEYPSKEESEYVLQTLIKRQKKILDYYYPQVTHIEFVKITDNRLILKDISPISFEKKGTNFKIQVKNENGKTISTNLKPVRKEGKLIIDLKNLLNKDMSYIIVTVKKINTVGNSAPAAQFHLIKQSTNKFKIAGVVH